MAKSLIDESMAVIGDKNAVKKPGKSEGAAKASADRIKLIIAIVVLTIGVGLIGYSQGWFDFLKPKPPDITKTFTPEQQEAYKKADAEKEKLNKEIPPSGS